MGGEHRRGWTRNQKLYNCKIFIFPFSDQKTLNWMVRKPANNHVEFLKKILKNLSVEQVHIVKG